MLEAHLKQRAKRESPSCVPMYEPIEEEGGLGGADRPEGGEGGGR